MVHIAYSYDCFYFYTKEYYIRRSVLHVSIKMKKIISLEQPPITSYPSIAKILSLMWEQKEAIMPWFSDHFIQLIVRPSHEHTLGDYYDHADIDTYYRIVYGLPGLGWMRSNGETAQYIKFTDYIEFQINNNYCLEDCLDRYYFKFSECYKSEHYIHSTFIFGYDNERKEVYIVDFFDDGKYDKKIVSYDEINESMNNDWIINLFKKWNDSYEFDEQLMNLYFNDYLNSCDSFNRFRFSNKSYNKDVIYGLEYYDFSQKLIDNDFIDVRMFHILVDHKVLMKYILDYLDSIGLYKNEKIEKLKAMNEDLIRKSTSLRNSVIKYTISPKSSLLCHIDNEIKLLKQLDFEFVNAILN